jgi:hypothetical protein
VTFTTKYANESSPVYGAQRVRAGPGRDNGGKGPERDGSCRDRAMDTVFRVQGLGRRDGGSRCRSHGLRFRVLGFRSHYANKSSPAYRRSGFRIEGSGSTGRASGV